MLLLFLLAVLVRLPVMLRNPLPAGDGIASNLEVAVNLTAGRGFSTFRKWTLFDSSMDGLRPEGNRQPAMSFLMAALFLVTGPGFAPAQVLALMTGLFCLFMCWLWARRTFGKIPATFTLLVLAVTPLFVWYSVQPDSLLLFTAIFFGILIAADGETITFGRAALLGILVGISYLVRTQGGVLAFSIGFWVFYRGGLRRWLKALLFAVAFLLTCMPWFARNLSAFGSPTYTQGGQFLINENHWAAWEVRETPPEPTDMLKFQGPGAVAAYLAKGALRVIEPATTGSLHRGEEFGQPTLAGFAILALLALRNREIGRKMLLPAVAALPPMLLLVLHEHSGRYLAFFIVIITGLGSSGLLSLRRMTDGKTAFLAAALLLLPFIHPLGRLLSVNSTARAHEAEDVSLWLQANSEGDDRVVTYPTVELLIWDYLRPTLTMPNDYEMLLWPCLEEHGVRYVVVDGFLPSMRPHLASRWRRTIDGRGWQEVDPPPFLTEVYRTRSGFSIVYEMTGDVPDGFMRVDSLPRDNRRAAPPALTPW